MEVRGSEEMELRRGPWTTEEDLALMNYIAVNGEGKWNSLARRAGTLAHCDETECSVLFPGKSLQKIKNKK